MNNSIQIADIVKKSDESTGRVISLFKALPDPLTLPYDKNDIHARINHRVMTRLFEKEVARRTEEGLPVNGRTFFQFCVKEEATHVELHCGGFFKIEEVEYVSRVEWKPEHIAEEIESYKLHVGENAGHEWF